MIELTRLNNKPIIVNAELIKFVEQAPDTVLTLVTGDKLVVRDSVEDVLSRILTYRQKVAAQAQQASASFFNSGTANPATQG